MYFDFSAKMNEPTSIIMHWPANVFVSAERNPLALPISALTPYSRDMCLRLIRIIKIFTVTIYSKFN